MIPGDCWRCERPGHAAAECDRDPPRTRKELYARVDRYVERWLALAISTEQKRTWIEMENRAFKKEMAR